MYSIRYVVISVRCFIDPQCNAIVYLIFVMREYSFNWFHIFVYLYECVCTFAENIQISSPNYLLL